MSATNIFRADAPMTSDYERGQAKVHQVQSESRDAGVPGARMNPAMGVANIQKPQSATGRRP